MSKAEQVRGFQMLSYAIAGGLLVGGVLVVDYTDENGNEQKDHCFSGIRRSFKSVYESVMTGEDAGATGAAAGGAAGEGGGGTAAGGN